MIVVRNKTESVMATSIKIQRLVFEMNNALDDARTQEREFFQQWQTIGLDTAQEKYIIPFNQKINNVRRISDELRVLLISEGVNQKWHKSYSYLIEYIEKIETYNHQFQHNHIGLYGSRWVARTKYKSCSSDRRYGFRYAGCYSAF